MSASGPGRSVRLVSPAKVNLRLRVLGRRDDGYHEVETWLAALALADGVEVTRSERPGVTVEVRGPAAAGVPADGSNLAARAARAVLERTGAAGGLHVALDKHVPGGAGLGGGSSNAAAALLGALELLGGRVDDPSWSRVLAELGSDCPFFLEARASGRARGRGRGERLEPWAGPLPEAAVLVLTPDVVVPTAGVYGALARAARPTVAAADPPEDPRALAAWRTWLHDDLEPAAEALHPELARWRALFDAEEAGHLVLSGSGSSYFGLFPDSRAAEELGTRLAAAGKARDLGLRARWVGSFAGHGVARR